MHHLFLLVTQRLSLISIRKDLWKYWKCLSSETYFCGYLVKLDFRNLIHLDTTHTLEKMLIKSLLIKTKEPGVKFQETWEILMKKPKFGKEKFAKSKKVLVL